MPEAVEELSDYAMMLTNLKKEKQRYIYCGYSLADNIQLYFLNYTARSNDVNPNNCE